MKKAILLLTIFSLVFTSCGSDDDATTTTPPQNPIVGTWKYYKYFENDQEQTLDACELEETLVFAADGAFTGSYYEENTSGSCSLEETNVGNWSSDNLNNYTIEAAGESATERIIFDDGNTFYFDGSYLDEDDNIIETRDVYIKQ